MKKGTYIVVAEAKRTFTCQVGKLGGLAGKRGFYLYVGSALGSGGVNARVGHHLRIAEKPRWHFDYLRPAVIPRRIWYCRSLNRCEHQWASVLAELPGAEIPLEKFGATDCQCQTHLYYFRKEPDIEEFRKTLKQFFPRAVEELHDAAVEEWNGNQE
ncbi:GIY-YIG nuclease family protein [Kaarinaea lacus]